jgi:hypothetical protein
MITLKIPLYLLTLGGVFFFAFREVKIRKGLTDQVLEEPENASDIGFTGDISREFARERLLRNLPRERLAKYRTVVALKFLFAIVFIVEVVVLQR